MESALGFQQDSNFQPHKSSQLQNQQVPTSRLELGGNFPSMGKGSFQNMFQQGRGRDIHARTLKESPSHTHVQNAKFEKNSSQV